MFQCLILTRNHGFRIDFKEMMQSAVFLRQLSLFFLLHALWDYISRYSKLCELQDSLDRQDLKERLEIQDCRVILGRLVHAVYRVQQVNKELVVRTATCFTCFLVLRCLDIIDLRRVSHFHFYENLVAANLGMHSAIWQLRAATRNS